MYHISANPSIESFYPRIPKNRLDEEDDSTLRICGAPDIKGCMEAVPFSTRDIVLTVYRLQGGERMYPGVTQVPDSITTREVWLKTPPKKVSIVGTIRGVTSYWYKGRIVDECIMQFFSAKQFSSRIFCNKAEKAIYPKGRYIVKIHTKSNMVEISNAEI